MIFDTYLIQYYFNTILFQVRQKLEQRLSDLESLPSLLRETEHKLQDSQEKIRNHDKRNLENTKLISELTSKVKKRRVCEY